MKRYIITGASGFTGYHFLRRLDELDEMVEVLCLDCRLPDKSVSFKHIMPAWKKIDLKDTIATHEVIREFCPNALLHLAAISSVATSWNDPALCISNNTGLLMNVLEAVRRFSPDCSILAIGSSEIYGNVSRESLPLREDMPTCPNSPYAVGRLAQEHLCRLYVETYGMHIVLTRSFNHIGPRQDLRFAIPSFAHQIAKGKNSGKASIVLKTGNLNVIRDFTDVRDVVEAYLLLLENGIPGRIYNVCSGMGRRLRDIVCTLADMAGVSVEISEDVSRIRPNENMMIYGSPERIQKEIGWGCEITFEQTLKDVLDEMLMLSGD